MGIAAGFYAKKARFIPLVIHFRGQVEPPKAKWLNWGFVHSEKGEIFWRKTRRNETLHNKATPCTNVYKCIHFVFMSQWTLKNDWSLQVFSLNVLKNYLYLLKQSIFRALKEELEHAYLIVSKSSSFTSFHWCLSLCTAIFNRRSKFTKVRSKKINCFESDSS